jgi:hypothetical protein
MATESEVIARLESVWSEPAGFLWNLRNGLYSAEGAARLNDLLIDIKHFLAGREALPKRMVALMWYIPLVMEWNAHRVADQGGDVKAVQLSTNRCRELLESILGVP